MCTSWAAIYLFTETFDEGGIYNACYKRISEQTANDIQLLEGERSG